MPSLRLFSFTQLMNLIEQEVLIIYFTDKIFNPLLKHLEKMAQAPPARVELELGGMPPGVISSRI